jgi:hypothetical protein
MKKISSLLVFAFLMFLFPAKSQKLISGELGFLKGTKQLKIEYEYNNLMVGNMNEEDYIKKKTSEYNAKMPGKGDSWLESWKGDRKTRYQPKFEKMLQKYLEEKGVTADPEMKDAKYTMIVRTTFAEPGYYAYVTQKNASINIEVVIVETANKEKELAKIVHRNIPGRTAMGEDWDTGVRLEEAYAKAGKDIGNFLKKFL